MSILHSRHGQTGATLIEVLISMLLLGVGILGISAMQASTLKTNQNSYMRTQAVYHSLDIVERMHSNLAGTMADNYNDPAPNITNNCLAAAGCSAAQMAATDVALWEASVANNLPTGGAVICLDSTPNDGTAALPACDNLGSIYAVKIWWDDDRDGVANQQYVMTFQP